MTETQQKTLVSWLDDAYALEEGLVQVLEKQVEETADHPEMQSKLKEHLEETKRHAELVESCLTRYDTTPSRTKDIFSKMSATMNVYGMSFADDAVVKNVHSSYAAEHFEIATYTTIRAAAEELGDIDTVEVCNEILVDESDMAVWLADQLPLVVAQHLQNQT